MRGPEMFSRTKFAGRVGILMLALLAAVIYLSLSAHLPLLQADEPDELLQLEGEYVIQYNVNDNVDVQNPARRIEVGEKIGDTCRFTSQLTKSEDEAGRIQTTLAVNFETCEILVEEGTLSREEVERLTSTPPMSTTIAQSEDNGPTGIAGASANSGVIGASSGQKTARWRTWFHDPIPIWPLTVNWLDSEITYTTNPITGTVTYISGVCAQWWRSGTGWSNGGGTCRHESGALGTSQSVIADHDFHNSVFPCGIHTPDGDFSAYGADTHYIGNTITASVSDPVGVTTNAWASGDCAHLLNKKTMLYDD